MNVRGVPRDRLLEDTYLVSTKRAVESILSTLLARPMTNHRHEKRLASINANLTSLSCAWARVCGPCKPDHLLYTMQKRFCIKCNRSHWFFLEPIEFEQPELNPNDYWTSELEEMGFFDTN